MATSRSEELVKELKDALCEERYVNISYDGESTYIVRLDPARLVKLVYNKHTKVCALFLAYSEYKFANMEYYDFNYITCELVDFKDLYTFTESAYKRYVDKTNYKLIDETIQFLSISRKNEQEHKDES